MDRQVWEEFGNNRTRLADEVKRARRFLSSYDRVAADTSSRGPIPVFGDSFTSTADGPTGVYIVLVDGPLEVIAPRETADSERTVVKVGRTIDLGRRIAELAGGLPPGTAIRYVPIAFRLLTATEAHTLERALLDLGDRRSWSLGGEFMYAPLLALKSAIIEPARD